MKGRREGRKKEKKGESKARREERFVTTVFICLPTLLLIAEIIRYICVKPQSYQLDIHLRFFVKPQEKRFSNQISGNFTFKTLSTKQGRKPWLQADRGSVQSPRPFPWQNNLYENKTACAPRS